MGEKVTIQVMDRSFQIACSDSEKAILRQAADLLDGKMREVKELGGLVGLDKIAILAGLNLASELIGSDSGVVSQVALVESRIQALSDRVEAALAV